MAETTTSDNTTSTNNTTNTSSNFVELGSPDELIEFLNTNDEKGCVVTFSATWCGPCKASKPKLIELAATTTATATTSSSSSSSSSSSNPIISVPIGYVYENDLDDYLDIFVEIKAFPTYIFYRNGTEISRVEGVDVNFDQLKYMIIRETATSTTASTK
jgi:thiol-disulfide isomerase/thioredoxin